MDFVDLSSTTRWTESGPLPETAARFDLSNGHVTATAHTDAARQVLEQHGFQRTATRYALTGERGDRESVGVVAQAESHLWSLGLGVEVSLGIPTPDAIPPAPDRARAAPPARLPQAPTAKRRTR